MTHAEIIARATAEAERQGFELVAIHAVPSMGAAITLCLAPGYHPWAVHRFSIVRDALNHGGYNATRERALAEFSERLGYLLTAADAA
tara:strand:- start:53 stop:316 length:264 start_codon:yes stop_codon:yes gene_type:complete